MKIKVLNKVKSESVLKCTGKDWDQWISILEKAQASQMNHKEIVLHLKKKHKLQPWWQQLVASSYEVYIGRKLEGRNDKGEYSTTATKTFSISQKKMWKFLSSPNGTAVWLKPMSPFKLKVKAQYEVEGGIFGEVRTMKEPLRARLTWQDSEDLKKTIVQLYVISRPKEKCVIAILHEKLPSARTKEAQLKRWKQVLLDIEEAIKSH